MKIADSAPTHAATRDGFEQSGRGGAVRRVAKVLPHRQYGRSFRAHYTGNRKEQTARSGARALQGNVTTLISRVLGRKSKNMRKLLIMNYLRCELQVHDFQPVRAKMGVFRVISHP